MELHELVAEAIDPLVVDGGEVPVVPLHESKRHRMYRRRLRQQLLQLADAVAPALELAHRIGHERQHRRGVDLRRMHAALRHLRGDLRRMHAAGRKRRPRAFLRGPELHLVRDHGTTDRLGRMRGVPANHVRTKPALREDVPQRLAAAAGACHRANAGAVGHRLGEAEHAVRIRATPGGDRVPEDRREDRARGGEVARGTPRQERRERRHQPLRQERADHLPVRSVPADEQDAPGHALTELAGDGHRGRRLLAE